MNQLFYKTTPFKRKIIQTYQKLSTQNHQEPLKKTS